MLNLGWMYRHGKGVKRDYRKALHWYRESYIAGKREALNNLAVMYFNGWGVARRTNAAPRPTIWPPPTTGGTSLQCATSAICTIRTALWSFSRRPAAYFWRYAAYRRADDPRNSQSRS